MDMHSIRDFRNRITEPHEVDIFKNKSHEQSDRKQNHQLTADRNNHAVQAVSKRLEYRYRNDRERRDDKMKTDQPKARNAVAGKLVKRLGLTEHRQKRLREHQKDDRSDCHDAACNQVAQLHRIEDALPVPRAVVVCNNRHHAVIQAEHRHENEALQLEVNAERVDGNL